MGIGFMWCQNLTIRREVAEGDWQATMSVEGKALTILLLLGTLFKVRTFIYFFGFFNQLFYVLS